MSTSTHGSGHRVRPDRRLRPLARPRGGRRARDPDRARRRPTDAAASPWELRKDDDVFNAAVVGMGCMGVIYAATIEVEPEYWLTEVRELSTWSQLRDQIPAALAGNRHYEVYLNLYGEHRCIACRRNRTDGPPAQARERPPAPALVARARQPLEGHPLPRQPRARRAARHRARPHRPAARLPRRQRVHGPLVQGAQHRRRQPAARLLVGARRAARAARRGDRPPDRGRRPPPRARPRLPHRPRLPALREGLARLPVDDARARHDDDRADPGDRHRGRLRAARRLRGGAVRHRRPPALGPGEHARRPAAPHVPGVRPLARRPRRPQREPACSTARSPSGSGSPGKPEPSFRQPARGTVPAMLPRMLGADTEVACIDGRMLRYANLDYAASTPVMADVWAAVEAFVPWYSSVHRGSGVKSQVATAEYEGARDVVARFVGARADDTVVFVRNTTEAINVLAAVAAGGHARALQHHRAPRQHAPVAAPRRPPAALHALARGAARGDRARAARRADRPRRRHRRLQRDRRGVAGRRARAARPRARRRAVRRRRPARAAPRDRHGARRDRPPRLLRPQALRAVRRGRAGRPPARRARRCWPAAARSGSSPSTTSPGRPPPTASRPARRTWSAWSRWPPPAAR